MPERIPVLLDTDPGSDIDDAVALAYLLRQPRCELVGVTTVSGEVAKRAAIVDVVCRAAGRTDVPIYAGRNLPLANGTGQPHVPHYEAVAHLPHRLDFPENQAVDFMRQTIRQRPGEIVLLTIGPYSNVATLFALDPEIPTLLRGLVSMGGRFLSEDHREWNAKCDPAAAAITYATPGRNHLSVGLDVTLKVTMDSSEVKARFRGLLLETVLTMANKWFQHSGHITFHDPLAAALIFEPDLCETLTGNVNVDILTGRTTFEPGEGPDRIASTVQAEAFFDHYFSFVQN
jgi:purine nucleosidase